MVAGSTPQGGSQCPFCRSVALDMLAHHTASCKHGGDVVAIYAEGRFCCILSSFPSFGGGQGRGEVIYGLGPNHVNSCSADVLIRGWDRGKPDAFNVTVMSVLSSATINEASAAVGAAAFAS